MTIYQNSACEAHLDVETSEPVCVICMGNEIESLRQQLAEAKKDARRYRWLLRDGNIYLWFDSTGGVSLDILDAVIDTAMRGEGE